MYELLYLRATEGARAANRGIERLQYRLADMNAELAVAVGVIDRVRRENYELEKKVQRLSLRILREWGDHDAG